VVWVRQQRRLDQRAAGDRECTLVNPDETAGHPREFDVRPASEHFFTTQLLPLLHGCNHVCGYRWHDNPLASLRRGAKPLEGVIENWWRQGMMGGAKAHYDSIKAFSETDFREDLKSIDVPTLVMHGDDDQIVPYKDAAPLSVKLLKRGTLKIYPGFPHGMLTTKADAINQDLLAFVRS
jgi:pimeloyl-ACP methyl ester carboxylesterase